jgi:hypothetical protein
MELFLDQYLSPFYKNFSEIPLSQTLPAAPLIYFWSTKFFCLYKSELAQYEVPYSRHLNSLYKANSPTFFSSGSIMRFFHSLPLKIFLWYNGSSSGLIFTSALLFSDFTLV